MYSCHSGGTVSSVVIASTGHASTHASQSMHSAGSMYSCSASAKPGSSGVGWMQSTGHTSTHDVSLVPMQGSLITYAMGLSPGAGARRGPGEDRAEILHTANGKTS